MKPIIYDDEYTGKRYTYGLRLRPLVYSHVPAGWIVYSNRAHPDYLFGTVDYPRPLTENEIAAYELEEVK